MDVSFNDKKSDVSVNSIQLTSGRGSDKAVHGFGNQYQGFDLSGQVLPILVQEQGVTRGQMPAAGAVDQATWGAGNLKTTYGGWPTYVTEQNRSFALADTGPAAPSPSRTRGAPSRSRWSPSRTRCRPR
jgi:alpha-glucosidase